MGGASVVAGSAVAGESLEACEEAQQHQPLLPPHGEAGLAAVADGAAAAKAADAVVEVDSAAAVAAAAYG